MARRTGAGTDGEGDHIDLMNLGALTFQIFYFKFPISNQKDEPGLGSFIDLKGQIGDLKFEKLYTSPAPTHFGGAYSDRFLKF